MSQLFYLPLWLLKVSKNNPEIRIAASQMDTISPIIFQLRPR